MVRQTKNVHNPTKFPYTVCVGGFMFQYLLMNYRILLKHHLIFREDVFLSSYPDFSVIGRHNRGII